MQIDRDATLKRAEKLLRQGKLEAAIAEYVRVTSAHPADWSSVNALGDLYLRAGDVERAVVQFARVGEQLVREQAWAKAAAVYRKIVRISPDDPRGTSGLALVAERQEPPPRPVRKGGPGPAANDPDARLAAAREAEATADVGRACTLLMEAADLYQAQGRQSDALAAVAEASSIDPANAEYRARMLAMLIDQGELTQARCVARVVPELLQVAAAFERAGRREEGVDTIADAALMEPENQQLRERVLRSFIAAGELDRARQFARTPADLHIIVNALTGENRVGEIVGVVRGIVDREPHNLALRAPLVAACLEAGDIDKAREAARTSADWMLLSQAMRQQGRPGDALAAMHEATQRDPHDGALHAEFVRACLEAGDLAQARQEARTMKEILQVADAIEKQGDPERARQMRADALRRDPDDPQLRIRLIRDYLEAGERDRAHALLTLDVAGDDPELIVALARLECGLGRLEEGRRVLNHLLAVRRDRSGDIASLGAELLEAGQPDAAFVCTELIADAAAAEGDTDRAIARLQQFVDRVPYHVPALLRLIEMCVDGGRSELMCAMQGRLADAYLHAGQGTEARLIAQDLVLRAPWERSSVERLLRALVLCHDPEPEQTIADLLCVDSSFMLEGL